MRLYYTITMHFLDGIKIVFIFNAGDIFMNFIFQLGIILIVTFLGEAAHKIVPLPIPASIYGLLLMLLCLRLKIVKADKVKHAGNFLIDVMPLMFIPAAVGLLSCWEKLAGILLPIIIITILTTFTVMVVTGLVTQYVMHKGKCE